MPRLPALRGSGFCVAGRARLEDAGISSRQLRGGASAGWRSFLYRAGATGCPRCCRPTAVRERAMDGSRQEHTVNIAGVRIGGRGFVTIAGPCAVEEKRRLMAIARGVRKSGATLLRGGAFKPRTSPLSFQGLGLEGLKMLRECGDRTGLPVVTEVMDTRDVELVCRYADMLQIGSRNMQNFQLLREVGKIDKPVLLKRGMAATIDELLGAADYVLSGGNRRLVLCERGIRTFETSTRGTLDICAIPILKSRTRCPVIVDPSHAAGRSWLVPALARSAVAAGADGIIVEVHTNPAKALSDGLQALTLPMFEEMMKTIDALLPVMGRMAG
ncbi:MAG: 3-deoxy-7-phosphoheptulonate synthase [Planctomycetes bacterium RBG_16_59_8]|nr:MAG: 3-deoxy-7-phosphoheptulonate synthase [Planctomycetes bacterium RBG_16_59_8]